VLTDILAYDDEPAADLATAGIFEWGADRIAALCSPEASPLGLGLCSPEASPLGLGLCSPEASPLGLGLCSPEASPLGLGL
jgi:hypothetical protein